MVYLPILIGFIYALTSTSISHSYLHTSTVDAYSGILSSVFHLSSLLSLIYCKIPYRLSVLISCLLIITSIHLPWLTLQRSFLGLSSPNIACLAYFSALPHNDSIKYTNIFNIACLLGTSIGILSHLESLPITCLWVFICILNILIKSEKKTQELYLPQIVSVNIICFLSFLIEMLGESALLSGPIVLKSVWGWENNHIDYLMSFGHIISTPVHYILTGRLYNNAKYLMINSIGFCGVGSSMLTSLMYSFMIQQCAGICVTIGAVYFARASLCYYVTKSYGEGVYIKAAMAGILGRSISGAFLFLVDQDNHEQLNRVLFFPITFVIMATLVFGNYKDSLEDHIKPS
ncbi:hypothetical protein SteCoe_35476 [Stentor coeruleus]|uniref:Uncharacterized protein n=1 Tax=Stentor coeruleus TaxID=5963 RepID=A0A1R2AS69_9CILI|nr:hypothetical protein SteCoe_35476 [Stentor coeruleus]